MLITTDHFLTTQPFKLFWVDDDIRRVSAAGKLATAGAVAVLKNKFGTRKLVGDGITQATAPGFFTHCLLRARTGKSIGNITDFRRDHQKYCLQVCV